MNKFRKFRRFFPVFIVTLLLGCGSSYKLRQAASKGDVNQLEKLLLNKNFDINSKDYLGNTALMEAVLSDNKDCAKLLLQNGANPNISNQKDKSPLQTAIVSNNFSMADILIENGANINFAYTQHDGLRTFENQSIFFIICQDFYKNININTNPFFKMGASDLDNRFKLLINENDAIKKTQQYSQFKNSIKFLLENGADLNVPDSTGHNILTRLAEKNPLGFINFLDVITDEKINFSPTYTLEAMKPDKLKNSDFGIEINKAKIELDIQSKKLGDSPLLLSAQEGHITTFLILSSLGANRFIRNEKGETGLHLAAYGGYPDIAGLYIDEYGIDINDKDRNGETAFMKVCKGGVTDIYRLFLLIQTMKRSDLGVSREGLLDAKNRIVKMFDYLIEKGADINIKNNESETTLMHAAAFGSTYMIDKLISLGVDFNAVNNKNITALDYAKEKNNSEAVNLIKTAMNNN